MAEPDEHVQVDRASALAKLRGGFLLVDVALAFAVLVFQAAAEVEDRPSAGAVLGAEDVPPRRGPGGATVMNRVGWPSCLTASARVVCRLCRYSGKIA